MTGKFITIEGIEGAGKSTQVRILTQALSEAGVSVLSTREPGGSPAAEELREVFLRHEFEGRVETFLIMAMRGDHVRNLIRPALERGEWVVCDRFTATTVAYQGFGRGDLISEIYRMDNHVTRMLRPHLSIILDLPPELGLKRALTRSQPDRMEALGTEFFADVREGLLEYAADHAHRCVVVDASRQIDEIAWEIGNIVFKRFGL